VDRQQRPVGLPRDDHHRHLDGGARRRLSSGPSDHDGDGATRLDTFFRLVGTVAVADEPEGGAGRDLFFAALGDALIGRKKNEVVVGLGDDR
jgi:hypothetical protein